jgi:hypothetical protein
VLPVLKALLVLRETQVHKETLVLKVLPVLRETQVLKVLLALKVIRVHQIQIQPLFKLMKLM